ncbi:hypothetical protein [Planctomycetes bacterium Poly30]
MLTRLATLACLFTAPSLALQVANDECAGAQLVWGGVHQISNIGATLSAPDWPSCGCSHGSVAGADVWFRYVATGAGRVDFLSCGWDTMMQIFTGDCGALVGNGCIDDCALCFGGSAGLAIVTPGDVVLIRITGFGGSMGSGTLTVIDTPAGPLGNPVCESTPNSTGVQGIMRIFGQETAAQNDVTLIAGNLPSNALSMMLTSRTQTQTVFAGGSAGHLCLGGDIARFASQVGLSQMGEFRHTIELTSIPEPPNFATAVVAGETWTFQCWHRDTGPAGPTSNFTGAASVPFL